MTGEPIGELVAAARRGEDAAWAGIVARYTPLVATVTRRLGLGAADAADVNQTVWLRLVEHLDRLREPAALPGWIVTTARNEGLRLLRTSRGTRLYDPLDPVGAARVETAVAEGLDPVAIDDDLLRAERRQVLRDAFDQLPARCQLLLRLLLAEPPVSYEEIGRRLDVPVGSVGPTRARCLDKLRRCRAVTAFLQSQPPPEDRAAGRQAGGATSGGRGERHGAATFGR